MGQIDAAPDDGAASDSAPNSGSDPRRSLAGASSRRGDPASPSMGRAGRTRVANLTRGTVLAADIETAAGLWGKFMGLMGRETLAAGHALWLPESNGIHMMFMRFPIDVVFVGKLEADGSRRVVSIHGALPIWRGLVPLVRGAHGVLELPVGTIDATSTEVGDRLLIG